MTLIIEGLRVVYGRQVAVQGVSLMAKAGSFVSLLGGNGAGKTSCLNAIHGIIPSASGTVTLDGIDLSKMPTMHRVRHGLALVPEGRQIFPGLTVREHLEMSRSIVAPREKVAATESAIDEALHVFPDLSDRLNQSVGTLSGGQQQMVAVARGLVTQPKVLMLDEPSLGLAPKLTQEMMHVLSELNNGGLTILMVEQDVFRALKVSRYGYLLQKGRIVHEGASGQLLAAEKEMTDAFLGSME